ncbi:MAG TPA: PAS domain-containing sensor histidine kinase [Usitatibacter sp.]|nr:PAS domain-containing sensor histidine kinase [Usitatibacter sp.]
MRPCCGIRTGTGRLRPDVASLPTRAVHEPRLDGSLRRISDLGVVGVVSWDTGGRIEDANDYFLDVVGYSRGELASGRLTWALLSPADDREFIERLRADGLSRGQERGLMRRDGTEVFVRLHSALCDTPGKAASIVVDVSEQRRAESERLAFMERERQARAEAESAVHSRDDILAIVSHDLRNPLNIIAMSANLLEAPIADAKRAAQLGIIRRAVARMNRLIEDLLDVTQITSGTLRVSTEPVDVAAIVEEARHMFVPLLAAKDQAFECGSPAGPVFVRADRDRISQVLSNLVGNAHKFTPEGGHVELRAEPLDGFVRFSVADTGPGLSVRDLPHIFDRFWQARQFRRGGVGLGLPITKGIVNAHGGHIWAESTAGVGTTFFFTIPACDP